MKVQGAVEKLGRELNTSIDAQHLDLQRCAAATQPRPRPRPPMTPPALARRLRNQLDTSEARANARMRDLASASDISVLEKRLNSTVTQCVNISTNVQRLLNVPISQSATVDLAATPAPPSTPASASAVRSSFGMTKSPKPAPQTAPLPTTKEDDAGAEPRRMNFRRMMQKMGSSQTRL